MKEISSECVRVTVSLIKNGSVSPQRHLIQSAGRLRALWHYLRPEELGFLMNRPIHRASAAAEAGSSIAAAADDDDDDAQHGGNLCGYVVVDMRS